jgi:hypothetical protein
LVPISVNDTTINQLLVLKSEILSYPSLLLYLTSILSARPVKQPQLNTAHNCLYYSNPSHHGISSGPLFFVCELCWELGPGPCTFTVPLSCTPSSRTPAFSVTPINSILHRFYPATRGLALKCKSDDVIPQKQKCRKTSYCSKIKIES